MPCAGLASALFNGCFLCLNTGFWKTSLWSIWWLFVSFTFEYADLAISSSKTPPVINGEGTLPGPYSLYVTLAGSADQWQP